MANKNDRQRGGLARLDELDDYKVADGEPDVRGWDVVASDGRKIGEVKHLIADTAQMRVRYLEVELDRDLRAGGASGDDRNALIPIGAVRLNDDKDDVIVDSLSSVEFGSFPAYSSTGTFDRDYESSVASRFTGGAGSARSTTGTAAGATTGGADRDDFYDNDRFDDSRYQRGVEARRLTLSEEQLQVGKRQVERGRVRIYSHTTETPIEEHVRLREEHVRVERRPVNEELRDPSLLEQRDQVIEVEETAEEAVVAKRARVVEEVVVRKEAEEREETVRDVVRRTDVEVEQVAGGAARQPRFDEYDAEFHQHYNSALKDRGLSYEQCAPAYRLGAELTQDERNRQRDWPQVEPEARRRWEEQHPGTWNKVSDAARYSWDRLTGHA